MIELHGLLNAFAQGVAFACGALSTLGGGGLIALHVVRTYLR